MTKRAPDACEDLAYSKQYFALTRQGHTHPTAEFGAPTLIWHVAFWPRQKDDPYGQSLVDDPNNRNLKSAATARDDYNLQLARVTTDFDELLKKLQSRGRIPEAIGDNPTFEPIPPRDWIQRYDGDSPFNEFNVEANGFTLWWADKEPPTSSDNMMTGNKDQRPLTSYIRVRVQAEVLSDYSSITFFIDAGKPWSRDPLYTLTEVRGTAGGLRREQIFSHVENIKSICEARINGTNKSGTRYVDMPLLPEPAEITSFDPGMLHGGVRDSAKALLDASAYLYKTIWETFCKDFDFNLCDIAGSTDEVFANFRGLVLSTRGTDGSPPGPALTASQGTVPFARFGDSGNSDGYGTDTTEPNQVVKAFMPFMRRFRSEA